jgi:hypothetical protein
MFLLIHKYQNSLWELFNVDLKFLRLFQRLRNCTKPSDAMFVRRCLELFLGWDSYENPPQNPVSAVCFRSLSMSRG